MKPSWVALTFTSVAAIAFGQPPTIPSTSVQLPANPTDLIAVVDGSPIMLQDISHTVDNTIQQLIAKTGQQPSKEELTKVRTHLIRRELVKEIQGIMMYHAFIRKMTGSEPEDKRAEMVAGITSNVRKIFYEKQLPQLLKQYDLTTVSEADAKLRATGSSLEQQERRFVQSILGQEYLREALDNDPEIPLPDMKYYYEENLDGFKRKARARWEQLTVLFSKYNSREEADAAIRQMGTEAYFGGNMQAVAKRLSQEPLAQQTGGLHDWTRKGSLASEKLDEKIFSIPLNKMSRIIEDDQGFHIIKVLEREDATTVSFAAAQEEIRETLQKRSVQEQQQNLVKELSHKIPVWTLFPNDVPRSRPLTRQASAAGNSIR